MKSIRELEKPVTFEMIEELLNSGRKVGLIFTLDIALGTVSDVTDGHSFVDTEERLLLSDGFKIFFDDIIALKGEFIQISNVRQDEYGCLVDVNPLEGKYKNYFLTIYLVGSLKGGNDLGIFVVE